MAYGDDMLLSDSSVDLGKRESGERPVVLGITPIPEGLCYALVPEFPYNLQHRRPSERYSAIASSPNHLELQAVPSAYHDESGETLEEPQPD